MASNALMWWQSDAQTTLDNMLAVHAAIGGRGPGRRYATEQLNNAYAVLLSSQFQKFCRDLHSQAALHITSQMPAAIQTVISARFTEGRKLDTGNPTPANLGSDFNRLGLLFWDRVAARKASNEDRRAKLEQLNLWRNAISHYDFSKPELGGRLTIRLNEVTRWRRACDGLAVEFDNVVSAHLLSLTGVNPW